jgi:hypothetical protein
MLDHVSVQCDDVAASRYHPGYYAVFVGDPDGDNVEAVTHA